MSKPTYENYMNCFWFLSIEQIAVSLGALCLKSADGEPPMLGWYLYKVIRQNLAFKDELITETCLVFHYKLKGILDISA